MAEGWTSNVLCRFYLNGACRDGRNCRYSHDRTAAQPNNICRYYLRGCCAYGATCRYDHIKPTNSITSTNNSNNTSNTSNNARSSQSHSQPQPSRGSNMMERIVGQLQQLTINPASSSATTTSTTTSSTSPLSENKNTPGPSHQNNKGTSRNLANTSKMTVLKKQGCSEDNTKKILEWANAPEFKPFGASPVVPPKSYATAVEPSVPAVAVVDQQQQQQQQPPPQLSPSLPAHPPFPPLIPFPDGEGFDSILCPYAIMGDCRFGDKCNYLHGVVCELCGQACLHPTDAKQQKRHIEECVREHERDMELSFAVARSKDKTCGICMDIIMEKNPPSERRFGILPNCSHVFCLGCIRKWRNAKQFENKTIRSCPECRTPSDFVTPSKYWVDTKEDKELLIESYKKALSQKPCKYFKQGRGECPFAGNCFYLHAYPDGRKAELPPPQPRRRRNQEGDWERIQPVVLWDFLEEREDRYLFYLGMEDDLNSMLGYLTDSEESYDWSDDDYDVDDILHSVFEI